MGDKKELEQQLIDPSSSMFRDYLKKLDPRIDVSRFLSMARVIALKNFKPVPADASEARIKAHNKNVNFEISVTIAHDPELLVEEYFRLYKPGSNDIQSCSEERYDRILDWEQIYANNMELDPVEVTPEIDKPGLNGMTQLGQIIMISDDIDKVMNLIENEGASPLALCGGFMPLYLAEQLGREKIVSYLQGIQETSI